MKQTMLLTLLVSILLCNYHQSFSQTINGLGKIKPKTSKVYTKPDNSSKSIITLKKDVKVVLLEYSNGWYKITANNKTGWLEEKNIVIITPITKQPENKVPENPVKEAPKKSIPDKPVEIKTQKESPHTENLSNPVRNRYKPGISFGLSAACAIASFGGKDAGGDYSNRIGLAAGGVSDYRFSDNVALELDILYSNKGAHRIENDEKVLIKLDYIEIPLLINFNIIPGLEFLRISLGPYLGYNFNAAKITSNETFLLNDIKKFDYGISAGLGFDFKLVNTDCFALGKYNIGMTTVHDASEGQLDLKNNSIQIIIGLMIF